MRVSVRYLRRLVALSLAAAVGLAILPAEAARHAMPKTTPPKEHAPARPVERPDPDVMLIDVYKELGANHLVAAQRKVDELVAAYPNFRLGQLIRGDLLLMHSRPVTTFGAVSTTQPESIEQLKNLREEAVARLRSLRERPSPELVPRAVLQLRDDQRHVLVVDAKRSRLYVYENVKGHLKFITDYYISQGKLGVNKIREGDQKTPVGVYYITSRLASARLPDFYGAGALPISYPNEWDRINGRSGSGIWLHGTPSDTYSRPPLSSDGCVVLTNRDLNKLYGTIEIGRTPVVISDQVEFVSPARWDAERGTARHLVENWKRDLESLDPLRLKSHYSTRFRTEHAETLDAWLEKQKQWLGSVPSLAVSLRDLSLFVYPGQNDLMVATFTQDSRIGKAKLSVRKRQYWAREGAQWHIVAESTWQG